MDQAPKLRILALTPREQRLAARNLKRCPLCEALNSSRNNECFVCSWHGVFDHRPESIEEGLIELLLREPKVD